MALLSLDKVHAGYGDLQILRDVSLSLEAGQLAVLMGPNGAGKSTLLKSIFHQTRITGGTITFEGIDITGWPTHKLLAQGVAFVPQGKINFGMLTVEENLLLGGHLIAQSTVLQERLDAVYTQFPVLREKKDLYAFSLSGGQQQMVAIGRALMSKPKLLLMDEPSLGLAPKLVKETFDHIVSIKETFDTTILIVEHNLKSLLGVADYGFVLVQGEIVAADTCQNLKESPIMKKVFVGEFE